MLVSQTNNDQTSPYADYKSNFLIDNELYYIYVLQNGTVLQGWQEFTAFIFQCYKDYKRYRLHFSVLQGLQVLQSLFSIVARITRVKAFIFQCYKGDKS